MGKLRIITQDWIIMNIDEFVEHVSRDDIGKEFRIIEENKDE